jgi:hypothetical protein
MSKAPTDATVSAVGNVIVVANADDPLQSSAAAQAATTFNFSAADREDRRLPIHTPAGC